MIGLILVFMGLWFWQIEAAVPPFICARLRPRRRGAPIPQPARGAWARGP